MEAGKKAKATEKVGSEQQKMPWQQKAKNGSVFPAKRRSVKKMMWDLLVESIAGKDLKMDSNNKNNNSVHPCTSEPLSDD